jgi:hypothetical protein
MAVIVKYKGKHFLWYSTTSNSNARLIDSEGKKYSGTPAVDKLEIIRKKLVHATFIGHTYVKTKQGAFSCSTGKPVINTDILNLLDINTINAEGREERSAKPPTISWGNTMAHLKPKAIAH